MSIPAKKVIRLNELNQKIAYAYYGLSVSFYLQSDAARADNAVQKLPELSSVQQRDLKLLVAADLESLVKANGGFLDQVEAYKLRYLETSGSGQTKLEQVDSPA